MNETVMNIGDAARQSGVSPKMIRHYERVGLIPATQRTDSGYRRFADSDVHTLAFIRRARDLGFSIRQIGDLLDLWRNQRRASSKVKALALAHIAELHERIRVLEAMKRVLEQLATSCHGDDRPDCPILDELASVYAAAKPTTQNRAKRPRLPA